MYGFIDGQATFPVIVACGMLIAFSGICTPAFVSMESQGKSWCNWIPVAFWKKYYKFSDITRSVHKENGALEIYVGDKKYSNLMKM